MAYLLIFNIYRNEKKRKTLIFKICNHAICKCYHLFVREVEPEYKALVSI